jgi:hypothetical protein
MTSTIPETENTFIMKNQLLRSLGILFLSCSILYLAGCGRGIDVVDAGTYTGTVDKAKPGEQEIYLSLDDGMYLELYFTETTQLMEGATPADFSALEAGDRVQVTLDREGNRNIPVQVVIME